MRPVNLRTDLGASPNYSNCVSARRWMRRAVPHPRIPMVSQSGSLSLIFTAYRLMGGVEQGFVWKSKMTVW